MIATKEWVKDLLIKVLKINKDALTPRGTIISFMGNTAPDGYFICDGAKYNITDYPDFAQYLKDQFGNVAYFGGDGTTTFAVPDLRGEFLRGTGTATRNTGSGATVGAHQDGTEQNLTGFINNMLQVRSRIDNSTSWNTAINVDKMKKVTTKMYYNTFTGTTDSSTTDLEAVFTSRPTNTSVLYCIKY